MEGYILRKGDLIASGQEVGVITKTTPRYVYYLFKNHIARVKKETVWQSVDTKKEIFISYGSKSRRRPQRRMRTLDLHGTRHEKAEEKIKKFLNFVELPCRIVTGNSDKMKLIVNKILEEYGWSCRVLDDYNTGTLVVVED